MDWKLSLEPEAVPSGFVTGEDLGLLRQSKSDLGRRDLGQEGVEVAGPDGPQPWLLSRTDGESELPGPPAELEGKVKHWGGRDARSLESQNS